jgi:hypothetical protein
VARWSKLSAISWSPDRSPARRGRLDGFVFLVAQDAGHFGEAALRAGERTAESAHPLDDGQIAGAEPARRIAVPQRLVFRLQVAISACKPLRGCGT